MKKQFVSELELISQLSAPNAVIGPISLCFLQLASLIHCTEKDGGNERKGIGAEGQGGTIQRLHGSVGELVNPPPHSTHRPPGLSSTCPGDGRRHEELTEA